LTKRRKTRGKINISNNFSDDVQGRNCQWEFPEWEIPDEKVSGWYMEFWDDPDICKKSLRVLFSEAQKIRCYPLG